MVSRRPSTCLWGMRSKRREWQLLDGFQSTLVIYLFKYAKNDTEVMKIREALQGRELDRKPELVTLNSAEKEHISKRPSSISLGLFSSPAQSCPVEPLPHQKPVPRTVYAFCATLY